MFTKTLSLSMVVAALIVASNVPAEAASLYNTTLAVGSGGVASGNGVSIAANPGDQLLFQSQVSPFGATDVNDLFIGVTQVAQLAFFSSYEGQSFNFIQQSTGLTFSGAFQPGFGTQSLVPVTTVPEPSSLLGILGFGTIGGFAFFHRRLSNKKTINS